MFNEDELTKHLAMVDDSLKTADVSKSASLSCSAKPSAPCTTDEFMDSVWEMYKEWCVTEDVVRLPDFEEAYHFVKEHGLPD